MDLPLPRLAEAEERGGGFVSLAAPVHSPGKDSPSTGKALIFSIDSENNLPQPLPAPQLPKGLQPGRRPQVVFLCGRLCPGGQGII